jgi:16S rRNA (guanine1207-N2)-methyltransferase
MTKHIKNQNIKISSELSSVYCVKTCHDLVIIMFPKSKAELNFTLAMIAHCVDENSKIVFVGEKKGGIQSIAKITKDVIATCQKVDAARHCMVFLGSFKPNKLIEVFNLNEWFTIYEVAIADITLKVASLPGVFSQKKN